MFGATQDLAAIVGAFLDAIAVVPPFRGVSFLGRRGFFDESGPRFDDAPAEKFASDPQVGIEQTPSGLAGKRLGQVGEEFDGV